MKRKNYKCVQCSFTCFIPRYRKRFPDGNVACTLSKVAQDHLFYAEHAGFEPIK